MKEIRFIKKAKEKYLKKERKKKERKKKDEVDNESKIKRNV